MRKLIMALGAALTGVLLLFALALIALPAERIARLAGEQIARATGREVVISGEVSMTVWPVLGAAVDGLEIGNAAWSAAGPMLTARSVAIGVDARALLNGTVRLTNISAQSPVIRLESRADGRANWVFDAPASTGAAAPTAPAPPPESAVQPLSIDRLEIRDATLIYAAEGSDPVTLAGADLTLDWPDPAGAAQIAATLRPAGAPVTIRAQIARFAALLGGESSATVAELGTDAGTAGFEGSFALSGAAQGDLTLTSSQTATFLSRLGLTAADLPEGLGRRVDLTAALDLSAARVVTLTGFDADLGGNRLTGDLRADLGGAVPVIAASVQTGTLDLTGGAPSGGTSAQGGSGTAPSGWPTAPIDASALASFNGEIAFAAEAVLLDGLTLGRTRATLRNDRARMVFALDQLAAYGGQVTGQFVMNNRSGLSVGGDMTGSGLALEGLLPDLAGITRLSGALSASVEFLGVGENVDAIMRSLRASGRVQTGTGTIRGIDLDRLMRSGQGAGGTTVFDSLSASFTMENGVMRNEDLLMTLPNFEARGAGRVDLGGQTLDYTFTPKALRGNDGRGVAIPVKVRGPWAAPRVTPDLEAMIDLNFAAEKEELQQKAQDEIADELGVERQEGQSLEDAVVDKIEDEIKDELRRGLERLFD